MTLLNTFQSLLKNKSFKFIFFHMLLIIFFAALYWFSDIWMYHNKDLAKKLGLGYIKQVDSYDSYLYFSSITQTTIGFGGILPDGGNVVTTKSVPLRIINFIQMWSIIVVTGLALS